MENKMQEALAKSIKNNPFMNMMGLIPDSAVDDFIMGATESFRAGTSFIPDVVKDYMRTSFKRSSHHFINANRHMLTGTHKILDSMEDTVKSI